jgi:hypothetical protein
VISQVYGGGGNSGASFRNDFVELHNISAAPVDVSGWSVQYASATGTTWNNTVAINGVIPAGGYFLVQLAAGTSVTMPTLPAPDATGTINMSGGSGKVALVNTSAQLPTGAGPTTAGVVDFVGYGTANAFEGTGAAGALNNTTAAIRNNAGCAETDNNSADFSISAPVPRNLASQAVQCTTSPTLTPTASPLLTPTPTDSPLPSPTPTDSPLLTPTPAPPPTATPTSGPVCEASFTAIPAIQGSGSAAAITGTVTTQGVVVGDYEVSAGFFPTETLRGFYLQAETEDGNPLTSDGIFVFNGANTDLVSIGQRVRVTGTAAEFQGQTQVSATSIVVCGAGVLPEPVDVTLPVPDSTYLERFEGMRVRLPQTLYVTEHFQLGRFGQITLASGDRQRNPTHIAAPGAPAQAVAAANALNRIVLDDTLQKQNPDPIIFGGGSAPLAANNTLRGGDTATGIVGVLGFTWGGNSASPNAYRVRPTDPVTFVPANPRPIAPTAITGNVRVAAFNVLNYFNTFDGRPDPAGNDNCAFGVGGAPADCRGADTQQEFDRQWPKTVAAILSLNADIVGVIEIENDGYDSSSAIADLVTKLNAATAPGTYAFIDADAGIGVVNAMGTDAIKVGLIYKPASVAPVGAPASLRTGAFGPITLTNSTSQQRNRPPLLQTFQHTASGEKFSVVVNHYKSKGSACTDQVSPIGSDPDTGDGQGNCNQTRTIAAQEMMTWLATDPTGSGDPDVLIIGDLNAYAKEDPVTAIKNAGYVNLTENALGDAAYSFAFDGTWGYLDHALASNSLASQVSGLTEFHINADEPSVLDYNEDFKSAGQQVSLYAPDRYRASDHDPVIIGLNFGTSATATPVPTETATPIPTQTNTPIPTETNTPIPTETNTPVPTETNTPVPTETNTPVPTETNTPVPTQTNTPVPTETNTPVPTQTNTPIPTETNTPVPTQTSTPGVPGLISDEAENFVLTSPMLVGIDADASNGQYVSVPSGSSNTTCNANSSAGWASYTFNVAQAGVHRIWARTLAQTGSSDSFCFQLDNGSVSTWSVPRATDWQWNPVRNTTFNLSAGVHTIRFRYREINTRLDKVLLTTDLSYTPSGFGPGSGPTPTPVATATPTLTPVPGSSPTPTQIPTSTQTPVPTLTPTSTATPAPGQDQYIEAESGSLLAPLSIGSDSAASGGQFIWSQTAKDTTCTNSNTTGWATYTVNVAAGTYKLWGRALGPTTASDSFCVQVDNGMVQTWNLTTGSVWNWKVMTSSNLTLTAGQHTIRVRYRENGAKLDRMLLTSNLGLVPQ